jgi:hypothetical protein
MIEWLQNFSGIKNSGINMERLELESLRKEMSKYKKKYEKEDDEMKVNSDSVKELILISFRKVKIMKIMTKLKR